MTVTIPTLALVAMLACTVWAAVETIAAVDLFITRWRESPQRRQRRAAHHLQKRLMKAQKHAVKLSPAERDAQLGGFMAAFQARERAEAACRGLQLVR